MRCEKCKVQVEGSHTRCPLCQGALTGQTGSAPIFPRIPTRPKLGRRFISFALFISITAAILSLAINYLIPSPRWWSLFVVAGIGSFWLSFSMVLRKRGNLNKTIIYQVVLISAIAILWDLGTGFHRWSLEYVIPSLATCAMIALSVLAKALNMRTSDYVIYLVLDSLVAVVSVLSILLGWVRVTFPSVICITASVICLTGILVFDGGAVLAEIKRRTHV